VNFWVRLYSIMLMCLLSSSAFAHADAQVHYHLGHLLGGLILTIIMLTAIIQFGKTLRQRKIKMQ